MAITCKTESTIHGHNEKGYYGKIKGKRKKVYLINDPQNLLFVGWELPIKADTETNQFIGNARLNLLGNSKEEVKKYVLENAVNLTETIKRMINFVEVTEGYQDNIYTPLF
ncbi:hypothetical protein SAMN04489761_3368 [Tenacibaculum sp. MAR_2009_124]|nr:hypothetical protein [Tenacibaculum sp. MAR_2009_124]SEC64054.1 hypothetical protein SAMN04489761_3368 [Tenacibaculum sp. MAR_2009_124]